MTAILVTGGAGFIGSNYVRHARASRPDQPIVVLDKLTYAGRRENLDGIEALTFVEGDIANAALVEDLLRRLDIRTIVHFAAESHVDVSLTNPDAFIETNVEGTHSLLKAAKAVWLDGLDMPAHRFHHVSTDEVFGSLNFEDPPCTEDAPYRPNSPYSASKAASDHLVRAYHRSFGLQTTVSIGSNNYGPYQYPEKLIPLFLTRALRGAPLPLYGDGLNRREWIHVSDHCRGIDAVLSRGKAGECYNLGSGIELNNLTVTERLLAVLDRAFENDRDLSERFPEAPPSKGEPSLGLRRRVKDRAGHDRRYAIDVGKAERDLGFKARMNFDEALAETVDWYLSNEGWWGPLERDLAARLR